MPEPYIFILLGLAAFRATLILTTDTITQPLREKIWSKWPPSTTFGYFWTCNWCTGTWVAAVFTVFWYIAPDWLVMVSLFLALSAVIGLISGNLKY